MPAVLRLEDWERPCEVKLRAWQPDVCSQLPSSSATGFAEQPVRPLIKIRLLPTWLLQF